MEIFPGYGNSEFYVNPYCNVTCVRNVATLFLMMALVVGLAVGELIIGFFFYFYISSKIKNAQQFTLVRKASIFLIIINLLIANKFIEVSMKDNNWKRAFIAYHLAYDPKYFNNPVNRQIASEVFGQKIKPSSKDK